MALMAVLCLSSLFFISQLFANGTWNKRETIEHNPISFDTKSGDTPYKIEVKDGIGETGVRRFRVLRDGTIAVFDTTGVTKFTVDGQGRVNKDQIVLIDDINDLHAWTGLASTTGTSYFVMEWGKHYIVDPWAISNSQSLPCDPAGTTAIPMGGNSWSEVTGILPWLSGESVYKTVTVELAQTGITGYNGLSSGTTSVSIWAASHPAVTSYGRGDMVALDSTALATGATYQVTVGTYIDLATLQTADASDPFITNISSGGSVYWNLNLPGEQITFKASPVLGSTVSAYPVRHDH